MEVLGAAAFNGGHGGVIEELEINKGFIKDHRQKNT
jgi:hypothetical protein